MDPAVLAHYREIAGDDAPCGCAVAWNPSAPGVKSEDTFLLLADGTQEIVSETPAFPALDSAGVAKTLPLG